MAKWVLYVMLVAVDQATDPELDLHHEHISNGRRLNSALQRALDNNPAIIGEMKNLTTIPSHQMITSPPMIVKGEKWQKFVTITEPILAPLHSLLFSLVVFPRDQIRTISIRSPLHRYLSLVIWNPITKSFYHANDFVMILAKMQWMMRLVVFSEYRQRVVDEEDVQLRYEISIVSGIYI
jgi:hypothetical protein